MSDHATKIIPHLLQDADTKRRGVTKQAKVHELRIAFGRYVEQKHTLIPLKG